MTRQTLVVMVKEPHPGRVKTRLGRELGMIAAAWWFRHQVARLLRRVEDPRWRLVLAVSPDAEGLASRVWPAHLPRMPQGKGDLGDRMRRIFRSLPPGPVCIVGADIPGIDRPHIARAFAALGRHYRAQADDGGARTAVRGCAVVGRSCPRRYDRKLGALPRGARRYAERRG